MSVFFFFNDTATTEIYTLSLHDALPILVSWSCISVKLTASTATTASESSMKSPSWLSPSSPMVWSRRSEEHTSELQSRQYLVCRLLLEKKNTQTTTSTSSHYIQHRAPHQ